MQNLSTLSNRAAPLTAWATVAQQVAAGSQKMSATVQEQVSATQQLNAQMAQARSAVERLTEQIARFRLAENGAPPAQNFGQVVELPRAA